MSMWVPSAFLLEVTRSFFAACGDTLFAPNLLMSWFSCSSDMSFSLTVAIRSGKDNSCNDGADAVFGVEVVGCCEFILI